MAAKSDFAQKLLHDLRLRKERMGVSQNSARSNATTRDAYRNPGNVQRGSRQTKSLESIGGPKMANQQQMYGGSTRASAIKESSQQIVSYAGGRHQRSGSVGDFPVAFTYAVKNGGKLLNVDFSGSGNANTMMDFLHMIGRRSLDVKNIQNQTSLVKHRPSNGGVVVPALTTVQIKEISKGVQNLYEILRSSSNGVSMDKHSMDVGKELLKGAKGLEESLRMLVNLQEASELMVHPQRKNRITLLEVDQDDENDESKIVDQNQVALPRFSFDKPSKRSNFLGQINGSSNLSTHRRSTSYGEESLRNVSNSTTSNVKNNSEKGRISNVIAKLMGLEEVPGKIDSESTHNESRIQANKTLRPLKDQKPQQCQESDKNGAPRPLRTTVNTVVMKQRSDQLPEKQDRAHNGETKEKIQQKRRSAEAAENLRQERVEKKKTIRMEKSSEIKLVPRNNQTKELEKRTSQKSKQESQQIKQVKSRDLPSKESQMQKQVKSRDVSSQESQMQISDEQNIKPKDATPKVQESKPERIEDNVKEKFVTRKKVDSMVVVRRTDAPLKEEVLKRRNGTRTLKNLGTSSKHKLSTLKETQIKDVQQLVSIRSKPEDNLGIPSKHDLSVLKETQRPNVQQLVSIRSKQEETNVKRSNPKKQEEKIQVNEIVPICENTIKNAPQEILEIAVSNKHACSSERRIETRINLSENKPKKTFQSGIVALTENEKQLKEILIKDQLFLSTAETLFNFNIPVGFLHVDDHNHHSEETKLKLDCGYEILRRKARSQELSTHPYMKPSIGGTTIRFLDDLVKQLYKDLESLRLYGRNTYNEYDEADYLHHMLERDIYNKNPDTNSFWDFGWHTMTFTLVEKDEFVNDVEQDVLHILVDEMVDDLLSMALPF